MKSKPISEVKIENRQRREFNEDKIAELATSIRQKGLLHPIVLRDDEATLVAGERRLRAISLLGELDISITCDGQAIPQNHTPFITVSSLTEDDLVEAELEENILREDLTWKEEADAIARLHQLRKRQNEDQTYTATAQEIAGDEVNNNVKTKVRDSLIIQQHLDDPEVAKAKSSKEALKIINRKSQSELTKQLAEQFNIDDTPHIFHNGDFRDFSHLMETSSVDVILTDPPYGIGADNFGDQAGAAHEYEDSFEYFAKIMEAFANEASRVTKDKAHAYIFCDPRTFGHIFGLMQSRGWYVWPTPIIWNKGNGMLPRPDHGPRRTYEFIVYAIKGDKPVTAVYPDVISIPGLQNPRFGAEKPWELYENLLRRSVYPGNLVWDPFAGAGPIFPAANNLNVRAFATELSPDKYNTAKLRLKEKANDG